MKELTSRAGVLRFATFQADLRSGQLRKEGRRIRLQEQPFQILAILLQRAGEVVTREELHTKLWPGDTFVDFEHGLNNAVNRLREALCDSADAPRYIETLPRRGYRFIASVEAADAPSAPPASDVGTGPAAASPASSVAQLPARRMAPLWRVLLACTAGIALAAMVWAFRDGGVGRRMFSAAGPPRIQSIAVLPLENLTGDASQEYFVDGMSDALITDLAQISALRVISRQSVMRYKTSRKPLPEIARELNVDAVVEGTVARSGNRVRIDAQLIEAINDRHLWAHSYERETSDVLKLQSEIAQAIASEIAVKLTPGEQAHLTRAQSVNPEAYENYLKGRYYLQEWTSEGARKALEYFEKALQQDPASALGYSGLSDAYWRMVFLGPAPPREYFPKAEAAAVRALALDDSLAEAHLALAKVKYRLHWDWNGADIEFHRTLELGPNSAESFREYAVYLWTAGRFEEAIAEARRGLKLDPLDPILRADLGGTYLLARKYDQAIAELRKALTLNPESALVHLFLGVAYEQTRDGQSAIEELEQSVRISNRDPIYVASLGHACAVFGRLKEAQALLAELEQRSRREYVSPWNMAAICIGLGEKQKCLGWLEKAYEDRSFTLATINSWPWFDPLRSDAHFQDLVRRIGLTPQGPAAR